MARSSKDNARVTPSTSPPPAIVGTGEANAIIRVFANNTTTGSGRVLVGMTFVNSDETVNGKDDDGNGFVDDVHGIAYNLTSDKEVSLLYPLEGAGDRLPEMKGQIKGLLDLRSAIDSEEASLLKQKMS